MIPLQAKNQIRTTKSQIQPQIQQQIFKYYALIFRTARPHYEYPNLPLCLLVLMTISCNNLKINPTDISSKLLTGAKSAEEFASGATIDRPALNPTPSAVQPTAKPHPSSTTLAPPSTPESVPGSFSSYATSKESQNTNSSAGKGELMTKEIPARSLLSYRIHEGDINALEATRDGLGVFTGGSDGRVIFSTFITSDLQSKQVEAKTPLRRTVLLEGSKPVTALALSNNQRYLAIGQFSSVLVFDLKTRSLVAQLTQLSGRILTLAWDPRDELLAIGQAGGEVHVWTLKGQSNSGANSRESLEAYSEPEGSPVQRLVFHPNGRLLFIAHRSGEISAYRLIRTELELGLRDVEAIEDLSKRGSKRTKIGKTSSTLEELWIDSNGEKIVATTTKGLVESWEMRGVNKLPTVSLGEDTGGLAIPVMNLVQISKSSSSRDNQASSRWLMASGRSQRIAVFCGISATKKIDNISTEGAVPVFRDQIQDSSTGSFSISGGQVSQGRASGQVAASEQVGITGDVPVLSPSLRQTIILQDPVSLIKLGRTGAVLWGVQKNGKLLAFDSRSLLQELNSSGACR